MNKENNPSKYKEIFTEKAPSAGVGIGRTVLLLATVLSGLLGFYLGDTGKIRSLSSRLGNSALQNQDAYIKQYSDEELSKKINSNSYNFNLYNQIVANLKDKYVDSEKVKDETLFQGSLKGLVNSLNDKATTYFTTEEFKEYQQSFSGEFEGIGVRLEYLNNQVIVMDVLPNSPALKQDVKSGFIFSKVDGQDVSQNSIEEIVSKVRGESGTKVKIVFIDPEKKEEVTKEIERSAIKVESIRIIEKNSDTAVLEVARFTEEQLDDWKKMWDTNVDLINSKNYKNVVLDLRGNGGGYLDAAVHAANDFLEPGKLILTEKSKVREDKDTKSTKNNPRLKDKRVVVLINGGTASASEILAGSIKYHNKYKVIGTNTFGKGTVQNTYNLPDGGALKITTEYWLLPTGKRLDNENPITPDIEIKQDLTNYREGKDNVMEEALKQFSR